MSKNLLKVVPKINRKRIKYASKNDILENRFENAEGPIDTQNRLCCMNQDGFWASGTMGWLQD